MEHDAEVMEVIRAAFVSLQGSHPEVLSRLSSAIKDASGHDRNVAIVEGAFRDAAKALMPSDKDAAQTLFTVAETLAEISAYWGLSKDAS